MLAALGSLIVLAGCGGGHRARRGPETAEAASTASMTVLIKNQIPDASLRLVSHGYWPPADVRMDCGAGIPLGPPNSISPNSEGAKYCYKTNEKNSYVRSRVTYAIGSGDQTLWIQAILRVPNSSTSNKGGCSITEVDKSAGPEPETRDGTSANTKNPNGLQYVPYGCKTYVGTGYSPTAELTVYRKDTRTINCTPQSNGEPGCTKAQYQQANDIISRCSNDQGQITHPGQCTASAKKQVPYAQGQPTVYGDISPNCTSLIADKHVGRTYTQTTTNGWNVSASVGGGHSRYFWAEVGGGYQHSVSTSVQTTDGETIRLLPKGYAVKNSPYRIEGSPQHYLPRDYPVYPAHVGQAGAFYIQPAWVAMTANWLVADTPTVNYDIRHFTLNFPLTSAVTSAEGKTVVSVFGAADLPWSCPPEGNNEAYQAQAFRSGSPLPPKARMRSRRELRKTPGAPTG